MKEQDSRMPINVERQSRVTFGGTKKVILNITEFINRTGGPSGQVHKEKQLWQIETQGFGLIAAGEQDKLQLFKVKASTKSMLVLHDDYIQW